ncbi:MAG: DUF92 domain-containing protein [Candidatus Thorarchaeota archaeon]|nr:DUF92 domain-containing protein [Candidatus Thorarchaeota archaeon]
MFELLTHPVVSGLLVMGVIGVLAYKAQFVDISGLVSAFVVGFTVWYTGGPPAFTIVLFFFLSSGVATKFKYKSKAKQGLAQEGKGKRSYKNVLASGIIPMIFSIAWFVAREFPDLGIPAFWMFGGFVGAVATTAADTLASEVGVFSNSKPRLITNLRRKVPRGTIGAVSLLGEGMAAMAGLAIGLIAAVFALVSPGTSWGSVPVSNLAELLFIIPLSILTGFVGCNLDSLIGAALQNRFVCDICGAITDKEFHCGYETKYIGGFKRLSNVHVNLGSSTLGATLGIVLGAGLFVWVLGSLFFWIAASSSS